MKALGGVVFYDGGNVYSAINLNNFVNNYSNTIGVGLRYSTPIGPIRIDIGRNLNPVPGINSDAILHNSRAGFLGAMMKWRRIVGWTLVVFVALIGIGIVGGYFYLKSNAFREFAVRKIIEQANEATGGHTQIGAVDFNLSTLTAHLYGVVVRGTESADASPLLQVDKLTVGLKIQSVLHRKINLSELLIEHPVVNFGSIAKARATFRKRRRASPAAIPASSTLRSGTWL